MGTAVLSPHDCLIPRLNRHNQPLVDMIFPSPGSPTSRRKTQPRNASIAVNSCDVFFLSDQSIGLLPTPNRRDSSVHGTLSSRSSVSSCSSPNFLHPCTIYNDSNSLSAPSFPATSSANHCSRSQLLTRRSSSADPTFRTPSSNGNHSLTVERMYSSAGRDPFRLVQGNAMGNRFASRTSFDSSLWQNKSSKFSDTNSFRQAVGYDDFPANKLSSFEIFSGSDVVGDIRKRTQGDFFHKYGSLAGDYLCQTMKDVDARKSGNKRLAGKVKTGLNADDSKTRSKPSPGLPPVVASLRRPKIAEAANKLLAKCDWKADGLFLGSPPVQKEDLFPSFHRSENLARSCSDVPTLECPRVLSPSLTVKEIACLRNNGVIEYGRSQAFRGGCSQMERTVTDFLSGEVDKQESGRLIISIAPLVADERWAGPAYSNSPPPSSLPLPKFSLKQLRSCSLELPIPNEHCTDKIVSHERRTASAPASPPYPSAVCRPDLHAHKAGVDVAFATKDLRRILNLDSC